MIARLARFAALAACAAFAGCAALASDPHDAMGSRVIDDSARGPNVDQFSFHGAWQHISHRHDGRFDGTSSRSRRIADWAGIIFDGTQIRVFGVRGANGGSATIAIDGRYYGTHTFYAPHKEPHALIFTSPALRPGMHALSLLVAGDGGTPHHLYVNLDDAQIIR